MTGRLLLDTDVLIDYLRGQPDAVSYLEGLSEHLLVSAITVAELFAGVREGSERSQLDAFLQAFEIVPVETQIAVQGGLYRRDFRDAQGVGLADALVAATAVKRKAGLVTLNSRHFPMMGQVVVPYRRG